MKDGYFALSVAGAIVLGIFAITATVLIVGPVEPDRPAVAATTTAEPIPEQPAAEQEVVDDPAPVPLRPIVAEKGPITIFLPRPITTEEQFAKAQHDAEERAKNLREGVEMINRDFGGNLKTEYDIHRLSDCLSISTPSGYEKFYGDGVHVQQFVSSKSQAIYNVSINWRRVLNVNVRDDDNIHITYSNKDSGDEAFIIVDRGQVVVGTVRKIANLKETVAFAKKCQEEFLLSRRLNSYE